MLILTPRMLVSLLQGFHNVAIQINPRLHRQSCTLRRQNQAVVRKQAPAQRNLKGCFLLCHLAILQKLFIDRYGSLYLPS